MSEEVMRLRGPGVEIGDALTLTARPAETTAGAIVLLEARINVTGTFNVAWRVEGPAVMPRGDVEVALLGATTVSGDRIEVHEDKTHPLPFLIRATLDTTPLTAGLWTVTVTLRQANDPVGHIEAAESVVGPSEWKASADVLVRPRPFTSGDDVSVTMRRAAVTPTTDQALWVSIRAGTDALGFDSFSRFMDRVLCDSDERLDRRRDGYRGDEREQLRRTDRRTALPFPNVNRYRLLKAAADTFIMINCRTDHGDFREVDLDQESARLNRDLRRGELEAQFRRYLVGTPDGRGRELDVLPYLDLVRRKLGDVPLVGRRVDDDAVEICYGIIAEKLTHPCFLELIHSYWLERGGVARTMDAISWRFQNRAPLHPGRDPLAALDVDPLRPLSNILWGWVQDQQHRLTVTRREDEYRHAYNLGVGGPSRPVADARSRFVGAFHHLLAECMAFYDADDNAVVIANGFDVLNGLKEVHLLLAHGDHNQYGDLAWTARHEMLMSQWILSRPEVREFLPSRIMVATPEPWIDAVEAMNKLQGWSDVSVMHYRDLAAYGEQLLLGIRFGAWTSVTDPDQAANFARYFRREVQQYCHAYRAVTGRDVRRRAQASPNGYVRRRSPAYDG